MPAGLGLCPSADVSPQQGPRRLPKALCGKNNRCILWTDFAAGSQILVH